MSTTNPDENPFEEAPPAGSAQAPAAESAATDAAPPATEAPAEALLNPAISPARTVHTQSEMVSKDYALWLLGELEAVTQAACDARKPEAAVVSAGIDRAAETRALQAIQRADAELRQS